MTKQNVHFSSQRLDWKTPKGVILDLEKEFGKLFDPCPINPTFNGLTIDWKTRNFVNPPYGTEIGRWCSKAYLEANKGKMVILLVPSRTDTRWWHNYIMKADEIRFIKGRLKFDDHKNSAPFPSAIVIFRGSSKERV